MLMLLIGAKHSLFTQQMISPYDTIYACLNGKTWCGFTHTYICADSYNLQYSNCGLETTIPYTPLQILDGGNSITLGSPYYINGFDIIPSQVGTFTLELAITEDRDDGISCQDYYPFTLIVYQNNINAVVTDATCAQANGVIDQTISGIGSPFIYYWNSGQTTEDINNIGGGSYTVAIIDANSCQMNQNYTVLGDVIGLSSINSTICTSGASTITLNSGGGTSNYTWQQSTNGGASWYSVSGTNPTTTSTVATLTATRLFRVIYTSACGIDTTPVFTLNVVPDPTVTLSTSDNNFCAGGNTTLTATLNGGVGTGIYQWQQYIGTTWTNIAGATSATYTTPVLSANTNYRVISSQTGLGCVTLGPNTINVLVKPLPSIYTNPDSAHIINGTNVTLHTYHAASYEWSPATGLNTTTGATVIASPSTSTTYAITGTGTNGCTKTIYLPVTVSYSTDIEENLVSQFSIFPNPANKNIKISMNILSAEAITFSISDVLGKALTNWEGKAENGLYETEISIENLPQGVYFLSAKVGERIMTQKFVKE